MQTRSAIHLVILSDFSFQIFPVKQEVGELHLKIISITFPAMTLIKINWQKAEAIVVEIWGGNLGRGNLSGTNKTRQPRLSHLVAWWGKRNVFLR